MRAEIGYPCYRATDSRGSSQLSFPSASSVVDCAVMLISHHEYNMLYHIDLASEFVRGFTPALICIGGMPPPPPPGANRTTARIFPPPRAEQDCGRTGFPDRPIDQAR
jgi:hypothetical protein